MKILNKGPANYSEIIKKDKLELMTVIDDHIFDHSAEFVCEKHHLYLKILHNFRS